jgi:hypothetical protein
MSMDRDPNLKAREKVAYTAETLQRVVHEVAVRTHENLVSTAVLTPSQTGGSRLGAQPKPGQSTSSVSPPARTAKAKPSLLGGQLQPKPPQIKPVSNRPTVPKTNAPQVRTNAASSTVLPTSRPQQSSAPDQPASYQAMQPAPVDSPTSTSERVHTSYGTFSPPRRPGETRGGPVTPNPSAFFPLEAATDQATYGKRGGSALIDTSDIDASAGPIGAAAQGLQEASKMGASVKQSASSAYSSVSSTLKSTMTNSGEGTTYAQEHEEREPLLGEEERAPDPRVLHYKAAHTVQAGADAAASTGLSYLTGGISSSARQAAKSLDAAALAVELGQISKDMTTMRTDAHEHSQELGEKAPPELIKAIDTLSSHFMVAVDKEAVKGIPLGVGTIASAVDTASSVALPDEELKWACQALEHYCAKNNEFALSVADLLGIPREVAAAKGGAMVFQSRC